MRLDGVESIEPEDAAIDFLTRVVAGDVRFEHGLIAEMWDVVQAVPTEIVNRNGMF